MLNIGQNNGTGDVRAKFLKVFSGEVLAIYNTLNVLEKWIFTQAIASGKSAQFPVLGTVKARHFNPASGDTLTGQGSKTGEREIFIDDELLADVLIPKIDMALSHFEYRSEYVKQMAEAIGTVVDRDAMALLIKASRSNGVTDQHKNGGFVLEATARTSGAALERAILLANATLDVNGVPQTDRAAIVAPLQYTLLLTGAKSMEQDKDGAGNGSVATGIINRIGGTAIVKNVNAFYGTNFGGNEKYDGSLDSKYAIDATNTAAIVAHRGAVGMVKLLDLITTTDWIPEKRSDLVVSGIAAGLGVLRPESAVEIGVVAR